MNIHMGEVILKHLNKSGIKKKDFAKKINKAPQTLHDIFTRQSIDSKLLFDISKALEFNFFSLYYNESEEKQPINLILINKKLNELSSKMDKQSEVIEILGILDKKMNTLSRKVPGRKKNKQK